MYIKLKVHKKKKHPYLQVFTYIHFIKFNIITTTSLYIYIKSIKLVQQYKSNILNLA